ncbi:pantetheine-phosphate adenylyltransferase [Candidatus Thorarchaeota archaeon]|nr:MAG: pantetheine-phosphate adenylyltransferase [Candidatus Thorarchaeota archaeon]
MGDDTYFYNNVVFAGSFDHLHEGHKHILRTAFRIGKNVAIGLTTDAMLYNKQQRDLIQPFSTRQTMLEDFIRAECDPNRCSIFPIETMEGGADKMEDLEALIISDEISVVQNAFDINQLRIDNGLKRFHIIIVPMVRTPDGQPLSSTRVRSGEVFDTKNLIY